MPPQASPPSGESFVKPVVREMSAYHVALPRVRYKLNQNESPYDFPASLKERVFELLRGQPWNRYPELRSQAVRERLAASLDLTPDHVLVGKGSNEILQMFLTATVQPGTPAIITPPTFSMWGHTLPVYGAEVVKVPLGERFAYPLDDVIAAAQARPGAIIFCASPNNPTGTWVERAHVERLLTETDALLVLDQAYVQYGPETMLDLLERFERLVIFRTFSKALQLAGCRLGYCIARPEMIAHLDKTLLPFNLDHFSVAATLVALEAADTFAANIAESKAERERLLADLATFSELEVFPTEANFIMFAAPKERDLWQRLLDRSILIRPFGSLMDDRDWLRVTVGSPEENDAFLTALGDLLA